MSEGFMELCLFMMPLHPARPIADSYQEDLRKLVLADKLGYKEAWVGQHFTSREEPVVSPLMFMAAAIQQTKSIKFATGVINLPCFHPAVVASEAAQFDHLSRGRLILGIGPGALATDFTLFGNLDGRVREEMTIESIEFIKEIWSSEPPHYMVGKYWSIKTDSGFDPSLGMGFMLKPYQKPHPPIAVSVMSPFSGTAKRAGQEGWEAISSNFIPEYSVASHWQKYCEGAALAGRNPNPDNWRVSRNIVVAPTDDEARDMVYGENSSLRHYFHYLWSALAQANYTVAMKPDPRTADRNITPDALMDDMVIYGSPKTVAEKLVAFREKVGPFGKLVLATTDWSKDKAREERSMTLLATEVMPLLNRSVKVEDAA